MKRVLLSLMIFSTFCTIAANASVTVEQQTEPDYIINNGYSEAMAEQVLIHKSRVYGQQAEPLSNNKTNKLVKWIRNFYGYIDPAIDSDERIHHNIYMSPNVRDL